eukprot:scaffold142787_cov55-Cyclotella_meneghiniana.AAC.1
MNPITPSPTTVGVNLGQFQLVNTGRCLGSNDRPFSFTRYNFDFAGTYEQRVETCAGWCLQNIPPQYNMIALQVFAKSFDPYGYTGCGCLFNGPLGNPLPQYTPAFQDHGDDTGTLPIKTDDSQSWLCYKWKGTTPTPTMKPVTSSPIKAPSTLSPTKMASFPTPRPSKVASKSAKKAKTKSAKSS